MINPEMSANAALIHNPTYVWAESAIADREKYKFLAGTDAAHHLWSTPAPDDWSAVLSAGPFTIPPGEAVDICFALVAGDNYSDLVANAEAAHDKYEDLITGASQDSGSPLPSRLVLNPNVPNPFNPATTIRYSVPEESWVKVEIFDARGKRVDRLFEGLQNAGAQELQWRPENLASGVYFLHVQAGSQRATRKMTLIK
jgi:hypothetical protein